MGGSPSLPDVRRLFSLAKEIGSLEYGRTDQTEILALEVRLGSSAK